MSIKTKVDPVIPGRNPSMADGKIKPDWLKLVTHISHTRHG
jgi:hypothetical protein